MKAKIRKYWRKSSVGSLFSLNVGKKPISLICAVMKKNMYIIIYNVSELKESKARIFYIVNLYIS